MISVRRQKDEREIKLERFVKEQRQFIKSFLQAHYYLNEDECADVFQDSLLILWKNIQENKVETESYGMSSSTYFMTICKNKAMELLRYKSKYISTPIEINTDKDQNDFLEDQVEKILSMEVDHEKHRAEKETIIREIVLDMPSPCNKLLWGYYGDGHSIKELAEMHNYASENTVKVTKRRCLEKLRNRYNERIKSII